MNDPRTPAAIVLLALAATTLLACGPEPQPQEPESGGGTSSGGPSSGSAGGATAGGADATDVVGSPGDTGEPLIAGPPSEEGCDSGLWRDGKQVCDDDTTATCRATMDEADECFLRSDCGKPACKVVPPPGQGDGNGDIPDCVCSCPPPHEE